MRINRVVSKELEDRSTVKGAPTPPVTIEEKGAQPVTIEVEEHGR